MRLNCSTTLKTVVGPKIIAILQRLSRKTYRKLSLEQIQELSLLMSCGYSIKETIELLMDDNSSCLYYQIHLRLLNCEIFEDVIKDYISEQYLKNYQKFSDYFSFDKAIGIANKLYLQQHKMAEDLIKPLIYPGFMFIGAVIGLAMFYFYAFDLLINFSLGLKIELANIYLIKNIIGCSLFLLIFLMILTLSILVVVTRKKYIVLSYVIVNKYFDIDILKKWLSYQFIVYYQILDQSGLKTWEILKIIKNSNDVLMAFQAYHVQNMLEKGHDMQCAMHNNYLDKYLYRYIKLGSSTNQMAMVLNNYLIKVEKNFNDFIKRLGIVLQIIAYVIIGVIVILIYQIIMMPMGIIENM